MRVGVEVRKDIDKWRNGFGEEFCRAGNMEMAKRQMGTKKKVNNCYGFLSLTFLDF